MWIKRSLGSRCELDSLFCIIATLSIILKHVVLKYFIQIIKRSLVIIWRSAQHLVNTLCVLLNQTARAQSFLEVKAKAMLEITVRSKRKLTNLLVYTRWWSISYFMHGFNRKPFLLLRLRISHLEKQKNKFNPPSHPIERNTLWVPKSGEVRICLCNF